MNKIMCLFLLFAGSCLAFDWGKPNRVASNTYSLAWSDGSSATVTVAQLKLIIASSSYTNYVLSVMAIESNSVNIASNELRFLSVSTAALNPTNLSTREGQFLYSSSNVYFNITAGTTNWMKLN